MAKLPAYVAFALALIICPVSAGAAEYAGSEKCSVCHMEIYNNWKTTAHPYKLRPAATAQYAPLPLPKGYTWDDISYVIGGFKWKVRYIDKNGYIITTNKAGKPAPTQWNIATGKWVDYKAGEKVPYNCGPCHMTAYSPEGRQDGLPGIVGTWKFPGIHCEECHGPGAAHAAAGDKTKIRTDKSSASCGKCHIRGEKSKIPASKGFMEHHEQYNEYLASPHAGKIECVTCHDPHKPARFGIRKSCESCHTRHAESFKGSLKHKAGVKCIDCHMPMITKSAEQMSPFEGDVKTHSWKISVDPKETFFTPGGKFAKGVLPLGVVCLRCHSTRNINWAASKARNIHILGKGKR